MIAVDTNVLLYVHDPRDPRKQTVPANLLSTLTDGVLLWQVACEYIAASRKLAPLGYDLSQAWQDIHDLQRIWVNVLPGWRTLDRAETLLKNYSLSFLDALIIAASIDRGVTRLYSEDFDAYPQIETLELVDPFKSAQVA
jgi:predicted nucleic acid-binding protein